MTAPAFLPNLARSASRRHHHAISGVSHPTTERMRAMRDEQRFSGLPRGYGRRSILRIALGGAAAAASGALLAACGGSSAPTATAAPTKAATTSASAAPPQPTAAPTIAPTAAAISAAAAPAVTAPAASAAAATGNGTARPVASGGKLPSPAPNVPDAYTLPPAPFKTVAVVPGKGGKVSITKASQRPPAVAARSEPVVAGTREATRRDDGLSRSCRCRSTPRRRRR